IELRSSGIDGEVYGDSKAEWIEGCCGAYFERCRSAFRRDGDRGASATGNSRAALIWSPKAAQAATRACSSELPARDSGDRLCHAAEPPQNRANPPIWRGASSRTRRGPVRSDLASALR